MNLGVSTAARQRSTVTERDATLAFCVEVAVIVIFASSLCCPTASLDGPVTTAPTNATPTSGGPAGQLAAATRMANLPAHRDRMIAVWAGLVALLAIIAVAATDELGGLRKRRIIGDAP